MTRIKNGSARLILVFMITVSLAACTVLSGSEETHAADMYAIAVPMDYYVETEGGIIYVEQVMPDHYLFLPNEADIHNIVLQTGSHDSKAVFDVSGTEYESLDLDIVPKSGNTYPVEVLIKDISGKTIKTFVLKIMMGTGIGTIYFTSDDPENSGRAWVEKIKGNKSTGRAVVFDADGKNLTEEEKNQTIDDIHGRGATSWGVPKKGYQIKFNKKVSLISGAAKEKKWILLAQYKDALRMNDVVCKKIAEATRTDFTPKTAWVNLYYDGEYRGLYELTEKNEIKSGRININDVEDEYEEQDPDYGEHVDTEMALNDYGFGFHYQKGLTGPEEPGGFLIEMNDLEYNDDNGFYFATGSGWHAANMKCPELGSKEFVKYVSEYFNEFSVAVSAVNENGEHTGRNPVTGKYYYEYCDMDSLVDTYLVQTVASNFDTFWKSQFFYKDRGGIMYSGPIWDMDITFGTGWSFDLSPDMDFLADRKIVGDLLKIKGFRIRLCERYREVYSRIMESLISTGELVPSFMQNYRVIRCGLDMDRVMWPARYRSAGGNLQWPVSASYNTIVEHRVDWVRKHKDFLDEYFRKMAAEDEEEHIYGPGEPVSKTTHRRVCVNHPDAVITEDCTFETVSNGDGTHTRGCTQCENKETEPCSMNYIDNGDGTHTGTCSECGYQKVDSHTWDNGKVIQKATTSKSGRAVFTCTLCGATKEEEIPKVKQADITINAATVTAAKVKKVIAKVDAAGGTTNTIILGKKVKTIKKSAFKSTGIKTITVKTKKLKAASVKGSLKGSSVKTVKVKVGNTETNKKYIKQYKKIFTKENAGRKVKSFR